MKHLFTDGVDTVIAEDAQDANKVWEEHVGDVHDSVSDPWILIPDDRMLTIGFEDEIKKEYLPDGATIEHLEGDEAAWEGFPIKITASASAWAESRMDSFLCSTEY